MNVTEATANDRERALDEIVASYLKAVRAGQVPSEQQFLADYPEFTEELREFLQDLECVDQLAKPLRVLAQVSAGPGAGDRIGDCELLEVIGRGGMGVVYKARQVNLNRTVALKMLAPALAGDDTSRQRFRAEAEAVARLEHPHIVPIYEVGEHEGRPWFSTKLLEGGSLSDAKAHGRRAEGLDERHTAQIMRTIAGAVHYAHQRGILHRDLKPANILLDDKGQPCISDYGLAKRMPSPGETGAPDITQWGAVVGTPSYMAPEQTTGTSEITVATDVYGLGAILYELLTGRAPFCSGDMLETLRLIRENDPARPRSLNASINRDLETVCLKCLEKDPERRYANAQALSDDLARWLSGEPISAAPVGTMGRLWRWAKRKPALSSLAALAALGLLLIVAGSIWFAIREATHAGQMTETLGKLQYAVGRAEKNETEAKKQQIRAEERSRDAHEAVYYFSLRVNEDLKRNPHSLPLRRKLLQSALPYFRKFLQEEAGNPRLRRELAQTHEQIGAITNWLGSKSEALSHRRTALRLYEELLEQTPNDDNLQHSVLVVHLEAASQLQSIGKLKEALIAHEESLRRGQEFARRRPKDSRFAVTLARAAHNLGVLYHDMHLPEKAEAVLTNAIAEHKRLIAVFPKDLDLRSSLALNLNNLGGVQATIGKRIEALGNFQSARDIRLELLKLKPDSIGLKMALAASYRDIGTIKRSLGKRDEGLKEWESALKIREKVAGSVTHFTGFQRDLAGIFEDLGKAHREDKHYGDALLHYQKARAIWEKLGKIDPQLPDYPYKAACCDFEIGRLYGILRNLSSAEQCLEKSREVLERLTEKQPNQLNYRSELAKTYHRLGMLLQMQKKFQSAVPLVCTAVDHQKVAFEKAPKIQKYRAELNGHYRTLQQLQVDTGQWEAAWATVLERQKLCTNYAGLLYRLAWDVAFTPVLSIKDEKQKDQWNDKAMEILHQAAAAGFRGAKLLRSQAAFRLLRPRADFQQLLEKIEAN